MIKGKVVSMRKLNEYQTVEASVLCAKAVNSYFHLYECGCHHNHINDIPLAVGTPDVDDDPITLYLGYYN
jgi:hypothetical protein